MKMVMCTYCGKRFPKDELTPLYERGKDFINYYCPRCLPDVKSNLRGYGKKLGQRGIPDFYRFGEKGEKPPDSNE